MGSGSAIRLPAPVVEAFDLAERDDGTLRVRATATAASAYRGAPQSGLTPGLPVQAWCACSARDVPPLRCAGFLARGYSASFLSSPKRENVSCSARLQEVSRRGKPTVVVVAAEEYRRLQDAGLAGRGRFVEHLFDFPGNEMALVDAVWRDVTF